MGNCLDCLMTPGGNYTNFDKSNFILADILRFTSKSDAMPYVIPYVFIQAPYTVTTTTTELTTLSEIPGASTIVITTSTTGDTNENKKVFIVLHAKCMDIGSFDFYQKFAPADMDFMMPEYPGYSICEGKSTPTNCDKYFRNFMRYVINILGYSPQNITICGHSIGSGPACTITRELNNISALILIYPFASTEHLIQNFTCGMFKCKRLAVERWDNEDNIKHIDVPTLIIAAEHDKITPMFHSELLYNSSHATKAFYMLKNLNHHLYDFKAVKELIDRFLKIL